MSTQKIIDNIEADFSRILGSPRLTGKSKMFHMKQFKTELQKIKNCTPAEQVRLEELGTKIDNSIKMFNN